MTDSARQSWSDGPFEDVPREDPTRHPRLNILTESPYYDAPTRAILRFSNKEEEPSLGSIGASTSIETILNETTIRPKICVDVLVSPMGNIYPDLSINNIPDGGGDTREDEESGSEATRPADTDFTYDKRSLMLAAEMIRDTVLGLSRSRPTFDGVYSEAQSVAFTKATDGQYPTIHLIPCVKTQDGVEYYGEDDFAGMCSFDFFTEGEEVVQTRREDNDFGLALADQDRAAFRELKLSSIRWDRDLALQEWTRYLKSRFDGLGPSQRRGWTASMVDTTQTKLKLVEAAPPAPTAGEVQWMSPATVDLYRTLSTNRSPQIR